jgi:hypothetical protein
VIQARTYVETILLALLLVGGLAGSAAAQTFRLPTTLDSQPVDSILPPEDVIGTRDEGLIDADRYLESGEWFDAQGESWSWQTLPQGLVYRSYLAGTKESRMYGGVDEARDDSVFWSATLGARVGIFRYGTSDYILPDGFQLDAECSTQVRLDVPEDVNVRSADFRGGVPITYGDGPHRFRTGYYHLSSHLGDEFLIKHPGYPRLNYARDVLVLGYSYYSTPNLRFYAEAGYAFYTIVSEPWEFQAGVDYAPQYRTGVRGAPFFAINAHVREELNYSGNFTAQVGWAWRADNGPQLLRAGFQYFNGLSNQYSFAFEHEETFGFGLWYDF